MNDKLSGNS
jgi:chromosome segregation ATPase